MLEETLSDYGFDAASTAERLASYHRVENTYLSTFQMLGGLGMLLGTLGLAAVLLRNVFERRRELALLRAVGYGPRQFAAWSSARTPFFSSRPCDRTACALLAIHPPSSRALVQGTGRTLAPLLLAAVLVTGFAASLAPPSPRCARPAPSLRAE